MELRDLKTFVIVARNLSFNRAAQALNTAQSTISARIAILEEELGVHLFDRIGRKVALTDAGVRLLDFAQRMIDLEDEARTYVIGEPSAGGSLTVRVPESLCVFRFGPIIKKFRERFPLVRLSFISCTLDGLEADLRQGVTDLAFVYMDSVTAPDLKVDLLGTEALGLAAAPSHALARKRNLGPSDLQDVPLLLSKGDCSYRRMFEGMLLENDVTPGAGIEFQSLAALKRCLSLKLGVSILPAIAVTTELKAKQLAGLSWKGEKLETGILMIRHRKKWISPMLEAFMELVQAELGRQLR
jgi:DNA-binding transcriptional LysR family regulator